MVDNADRVVPVRHFEQDAVNEEMLFPDPDMTVRQLAVVTRPTPLPETKRFPAMPTSGHETPEFEIRDEQIIQVPDLGQRNRM